MSNPRLFDRAVLRLSPTEEGEDVRGFLQGLVTQDSSYANRSDWAFSGRAGALYHVSDAVALRGAAYSGFRLPTLNELYRPFVVFPITTQANAALKPEKLKGVEGGIDLTPASGVQLSATLFYNRLDDAIANVTIATNTRQRILDIAPSKLHERVSVVLGSRNEVERVTRYHLEPGSEA